jgi:branched-subunit amino acid ABC-type transport system permease component
VERFVGFALPGVPFGCTYALVAVCLVLTYQATGVFNFAFGAQAYASAFVFTYLTQYKNWSGWQAFLVSVVVMGPVVGWAFDRLLFRHISNSNTIAKMVCSLALLVGIPSLLPVIFGNQNLDATTTIAPFFNPNVVYFTLWGTPINGIYLSTVTVTVVVLVLLTILLRYTNLGLQMRAAVESRRLVQLDGVNGNGVVAVAWIVSSFMASLAGVLFAPNFGAFQAQNYVTITVAAIAAAVWALLRSIPIAALVGVLIGVTTTVLQGYIPPDSFFNAAMVPALPFILIVVALLILPGMRSLDASRDPLATIDPPPPPMAATTRAPTMDRIIRVLWWILFAGFCASMLTWIPGSFPAWTTVFNNGLTLSIVLLSITLITGMAGQLSLCQASLAGVGAFTAAQLANHLGLNLFVGGLVGAALAAIVAVVLALLSLRLRGLGLALMTLAAALAFDATFFNDTYITGGQGGLSIQSKWLGTGEFFNVNGHAMFLLSLGTLVVVVIVVLLVRKGTVGRNLAAMRGSETATAGLGVNPTRQRILVFALSGAIAGIGGLLHSLEQQVVDPNAWNADFSLVLVVLVVTTSVTTVEGAIQAGVGFFVTEQILTTILPARIGASSLTVVLFAFGALTYAQHPEGVLEYQKRRSTQRFERLFFSREAAAQGNGTAGAISEAAAQEDGTAAAISTSHANG